MTGLDDVHSARSPPECLEWWWSWFGLAEALIPAVQLAGRIRPIANLLLIGSRILAQALTLALQEPNLSLTRNQALRVGLGRPITINGAGSRKLPRGIAASCHVNSVMLVQRNPGSLYCLGFVAGSDGQYDPHTWVNINGKHLECSPQRGVGLKYVLTILMTMQQILYTAREEGIDTEKGYIPPLLLEDGTLNFLPPDADAVSIN